MALMASSPALSQADWLGACRAAVSGLRRVLTQNPTSRERIIETGKLEVIAIESADPRWLAASSDALVDVAYRVRAMGSIAISLCQVAPTRVDGMATLWNCRAVDAAAGQLVVRESGGLVAFTACPEPLAAPLDLEPRSPVVAARTAAALEELAAVPASPSHERGGSS